ncbi:hypothetical protein [Paraliomyxa miuraensis]|uniref:hypothetical protein n=1 Tax=Paraliomyxa miuraensis TaxID=376150 RepID=UPI0022526F79|nr:hypothetical protein [Paraliomyxa miuraensis]MCX4240062.1 hypothetical protein [Paraliomyxa miuraensis]
MFLDRSLLGLALASLWLAAACGGTRPPAPPPSGLLIDIPGDAPTNASSCDERLGFARDAMDRLVDAANGPCSSDADCTMVFAETQCEGACQAPILVDRLQGFHDTQVAIDERVCTGYVEAGCLYSTPACLAVEAVCDAGRCALAEPA